MLSTSNKPFIVFLTCITLLAATGCTAVSTTGTTGTAATISRQVPVQRGDLVVSVSVDGNLEMTDYRNVAFSASNDPAASQEVKEVLVQEGDQVKWGQLLAYLDETDAQLNVKSANNEVQL